MAKKAKKAKVEEKGIIETTPYGRMSWVFLTSRFAALHKIDGFIAKDLEPDYPNREIVEATKREEGELLIRDITLTTGQVLNYNQLLSFVSSELTLDASEEMSRVAFALEDGQSRYSIEHRLDRETFNFVERLLLARSTHPYGKLNYTPTHYLSGVWSKKFGNQTIRNLLESIYAGILKSWETMLDNEEKLMAAIGTGKFLGVLFTNEAHEYGDGEELMKDFTSFIENEVYTEEQWATVNQVAKLTLVRLVDNMRQGGVLKVDKELMGDLTDALELLLLTVLGGLGETNLQKMTEEAEKATEATLTGEAVEEAKDAVLH